MDVVTSITHLLHHLDKFGKAVRIHNPSIQITASHTHNSVQGHLYTEGFILNSRFVKISPNINFLSHVSDTNCNYPVHVEIVAPRSANSE